MPSAKSTIGFDHLGIGSALSRNRLKVPLNQREYSWEEKHVLDLLHDFSKAIDARKKSYFLGTIVLTTTEDDSLEVIDGQQRLATATILIAAIRDFLLARKEDMLVNSTEQDFLFKVVREKRERAPRLSLNVQDKDYFVKRILARPNDQERKSAKSVKLSHERMDKAARLAAEHVQRVVSPHDRANQANVLNSWLNFIENSAQIITLVVPDDLNGYVMFETLNDRGLSISQSDLLKNYLFGEANGRLADAQAKWSHMAGLLEAIGDEEIVVTYLRHLAISLYGHTREKEVFEKIKERVAGERSALDFLDALADNANNYVAMMTPTHARWNPFPPSTRERLRALLTLRVAVLRPLLLSILRKFPKKEIEKAIRQFVCWAVRFLVVGGARTGTVEERCAEVAREVNEAKIHNMKELTSSMSRIIPNDAEFEAAFGSARVAQSYLARYYLRALELKKKENPEPEWIPNEDTVINLEHVLPENPGSNWPDFDAETAQLYYSRLGNMVLLQAKQNTLVGNNAFASKKPVLKKSTFKLTAEVGKKKSWGKDEINERQKRLAALAVETWPMSF